MPNGLLPSGKDALEQGPLYRWRRVDGTSEEVAKPLRRPVDREKEMGDVTCAWEHTVKISSISRNHSSPASKPGLKVGSAMLARKIPGTSVDLQVHHSGKKALNQGQMPMRSLQASSC